MCFMRSCSKAIPLALKGIHPIRHLPFGEYLTHFLIADLPKVRIVKSDHAEVFVILKTYDRIRFAAKILERNRRRNRDCQDQLSRPLFAYRTQGRTRGCAGRDPVIDQNNHTPP